MDTIECSSLARPARSVWELPAPLEVVETKLCINLASYNYLGFGGVDERVTPAVEQVIQEHGLGSAESFGGGAVGLQSALEREVASFLDKEDAVVVGMGFATNTTMLHCLLQSDEGKVLVLSDAENHRSIVEGCRAAGARVRVFRHNDMCHLEERLQAVKGFDKVVVIVEGIYSMGGDFCRLREVVELKSRYGAYLYVDEAHSIGAVGSTGRGVTEELGVPRHAVDVLMGTFTKSFGSNGGYVAADAASCSALRAAFSVREQSAPAAPVLAQCLAALTAIQDPAVGPAKIAALRRNTSLFRTGLRHLGAAVVGDERSPVVPMMLLDTRAITPFSRYCFERGLAVVVVGYPAVPVNAVRARFCLSASHSAEQIYTMLSIIRGAIADGIVPRCYVPRDDRYAAALTGAPMPSLAAAGPKAPLRSAQPTPAPPGCSHDPLRLAGGSSECAEPAIAALQHYGAGTCGPRGFYGTTAEHVALERELASTLGFDDAIVYSHHVATVSSVMQAVLGPKDVVFLSAGFRAKLGARLSRAQIIPFEGEVDLATKLGNHTEHQEFNGQRLVVADGVSASGAVAPIKAYSALARQAGAKVVVDETLSFGTCGLRGASDGAEVDLLVGSFEHACGGVGGFCAGRGDLVDLQRLFGSGYCFSASAPAYSVAWARRALQLLASEEGARRRAALAERTETLARFVRGRGCRAETSVYWVRVEGARDVHVAWNDSDEQLNQRAEAVCAC